jgi:hypothetical protein
MTTSTGFAASHPAIRAYASSHGVDASSFRQDGRVTLSFDRRYRVQLRPGPDGRVIVSTRLLDLGELSPVTANEVLLRLGMAAGGMLRDHGCGLCIDEQEGSLLLMQLLPASLDLASLEEALAEFVNVQAFWTRLSAREAGIGLAPGRSDH